MRALLLQRSLCRALSTSTSPSFLHLASTSLPSLSSSSSSSSSSCPCSSPSHSSAQLHAPLSRAFSSSSAIAAGAYTPKITEEMAAKEVEGAVLVSTYYGEHVISPKVRRSIQSLQNLEWRQYKDKMTAARLEYKQEWDYYQRIDKERKRQEYLATKLRKYYNKRLKDVQRREKSIQHKNQMAFLQRKKAKETEQSRVNWIKDQAFRKAQRNFQKEYLRHEKKLFWLNDAEEINSSLFATQTSLTGFWPERPRYKRPLKPAQELGRFGPFPVVEDSAENAVSDAVYTSTDEDGSSLNWVPKIVGHPRE